MEIKKRGELIKLIEYFSLPRTAAELGVAEGRFSKEMFNWGLASLYLVDIWETMPFIDGCASFDQTWHTKNFEEVYEWAKAKENVFILKGLSHKQSEYITDSSLGLVYVDSDHSYNGTKAEIKYWWPKLVPGGIMAFHDYANPDYGVKRAVIEHVKGEQNVNVIIEDGNSDNIGCWIRK